MCSRTSNIQTSVSKTTNNNSFVNILLPRHIVSDDQVKIQLLCKYELLPILYVLPTSYNPF